MQSSQQGQLLSSHGKVSKFLQMAGQTEIIMGSSGWSTAPFPKTWHCKDIWGCRECERVKGQQRSREPHQG